MGLEPVELDEQLRLGVREVDTCDPPAVIGQHVELRHRDWEREAPGKGRELRFEHARGTAVVVLLVEQHAKHSNAPPPPARNPLEGCLRGVEGRQPRGQRTMQRPSHRPDRRDRGQIDQGAHRIRHGDALTYGGVGALEIGGAVHDHVAQAVL